MPGCGWSGALFSALTVRYLLRLASTTSLTWVWNSPCQPLWMYVPWGYQLTPRAITTTWAATPHRLELRASRAQGVLIRGPSVTDMGVRVPESLKGIVDVRLTRLDRYKPTLLFEDTGHCAGLEVVGDLERLLTWQN